MNTEKKNLIVFGYGLAVILAVIAARVWFKHHTALLPAGLAALTALLAGTTFLNYRLLKGFYTSWLKVARVIGNIISTVLLGLFFFLVFAPAGVMLRILKKDPLHRKIDLHRESYWENVPSQAEGKERYLKQY